MDERELAERRARARRNAILLALLGAAIYGGFIVMQYFRAQV